LPGPTVPKDLNGLEISIVENSQKMGLNMDLDIIYEIIMLGRYKACPKSRK
jgi:hypothetical protein